MLLVHAMQTLENLIKLPQEENETLDEEPSALRRSEIAEVNCITSYPVQALAGVVVWVFRRPERDMRVASKDGHLFEEV